MDKVTQAFWIGFIKRAYFPNMNIDVKHQADRRAKRKYNSNEFKNELVNRVAQDQKYRTSIEGQTADTFNQQQVIDKDNTSWLSKNVKEYGNPYNYGNDTIKNNSWLLSQHADHDLNFQKDFIKDMSKDKNYAFLSDRINIAEGKPQVYGTQSQGFFEYDKAGNQLPLNSNNVKLLPTTSTGDDLNKIRATVGLPPL